MKGTISLKNLWEINRQNIARFIGLKKYGAWLTNCQFPANVLTLTGTGTAPLAGDIVHFGEWGTDSYQAVVSHIEATEVPTVSSAPSNTRNRRA